MRRLNTEAKRSPPSTRNGTRCSPSNTSTAPNMRPRRSLTHQAMPAPHAMLPPLKTVKAGLLRTTEALAHELARAQPGTGTPAWSDLEWRLASAAAVAHGVSPLLSRLSFWQNAGWQQFLAGQHEHVELRYQRMASLLARIDAEAREAGLPIVPLKGSALHAIGLYTAGDRPMADIDLLVRDEDAERAVALLEELGYVA